MSESRPGRVQSLGQRGRVEAQAHYAGQAAFLNSEAAALGPGSSLLLNILNIHTNTRSHAQTNQHSTHSPNVHSQTALINKIENHLLI